MRYLITGGSGFIGGALCADLLEQGHLVSVLTRSAARARTRLPEQVELWERLPVEGQFDAVVNLAGENIAGGRWTAARQRLLHESRISTTRTLVEWIRTLPVRPAVLISGSAIGYYGDGGDAPLSENSPAATGFAAQLCRDWEDAARVAQASGVRVCNIRIGVVLGRGGALARLLTPFRLGLGGRIGSGHQWMSWIHLADLVALIRWLVERQTNSGAWNATAPQPVRNADFARILGARLRRPAVLVTPSSMLRMALGEMASLLLEGQKVLPERALSGGFRFRYAELDSALAQIIQTP